MKKIVISAVLAIVMSTSAMAASMPMVAKKNNCAACHAVDKKVVGPAWKDVAKKYESNPDAVAILSNKISNGGKGNWGSVSMPANPRVSKADNKELVDFILGLK